MGVKMPVFMIVPSLACQAACKYCFGPHRGAVMDADMARLSASYVAYIAEGCDGDRIEVILHGGEPLMAPLDVLDTLLGALSGAAARCEKRLRVSMQSNLWNLTPAHAALLKTYDVQVGTSLDGPEAWNDGNRGEGYFQNTMRGVHIAEAAGLDVNIIATVTSATLPHAKEILTYFSERGHSVVLHGALDGMDGKTPLALTPAQYAALVTELLPWYASRRTKMRVETLDHYIKNTLRGEPHVCTLQNCYGMFLCISPTGDITSCQRLSGRPEFVLGNIRDMPSLETLRNSPAAQRQLLREARVRALSETDGAIARCAGGCYYNALAAGDGTLDPLCGAYAKIDAFIREAAKSEGEAGAYAELVGDTHPVDKAANARGILALHALGLCGGEPEKAALLLHERHICGDPATTAAILSDSLAFARSKEALQSRLNVYAHVTLHCNLRCTHCYADASEGADMPVEAFRRLADETVQAGYRELVVTGGEPLMHNEWRTLADICRAHRGKGVKTVLRTNFTLPLEEADMRLIDAAFDQTTVSIDGCEETHDARRGAGSYRAARANLLRYTLACGTDRLTLTSVMDACGPQQRGRGRQRAAACAHARHPSDPFSPALAARPRRRRGERRVRNERRRARARGRAAVISPAPHDLRHWPEPVRAAGRQRVSMLCVAARGDVPRQRIRDGLTGHAPVGSVPSADGQHGGDERTLQQL